MNKEHKSKGGNDQEWEMDKWVMNSEYGENTLYICMKYSNKRK